MFIAPAAQGTTTTYYYSSFTTRWRIAAESRSGLKIRAIDGGGGDSRKVSV